MQTRNSDSPATTTVVVVGTEIITIATPTRGVVIFIRVNLATRPPTITTDVSVDLAKKGALAN